MDKNLLMIFIKNPVAGKVKTRLGASIGSVNALQVYKKLLSHTRDIASTLECERQVWYSSLIDRRDSWDNTQFYKKLQHGSDLGKRMFAAFKEAFDNCYSKVVIIGSDCADLTPHHIEMAFAELDTNKAVIGPSKDGGYYLLGLTEFIPELFADIEWSTPTVFDKTVDCFNRLDVSYSVLETLNDIDTIEDLQQSDITLP